MEDQYVETITLLKREIHERDSDIQKAATFGKQLLEDKGKLSEQICELLSENETLKQERYSLQLDLEAKIQTVHSQSSESEQLNEQFEDIRKKLELLQKENNYQKIQINHLTHENGDLEKNLQDATQERCELKKKIALQVQQIQSLQYKSEVSLNITLPQTVDEEEDINFYKLQNKQLQEALAEVQFELQGSQSEGSHLIVKIKELEEEVKDRDKEIKACSQEIKKSLDVQAELQGEIEMLKLDQLDVNRRGNSVFGELDDRRKLVEKEYKLLANKYDNMLNNYENNKRELSNCKGQMAILLSMTSRSYQTDYIKKLEENLMDSKREIDNLNAKLRSLVRSQDQQQFTINKICKGGDEYDYLRVMYEQAEKKNKCLENELVTQRMQNRTDKDHLTCTQQHLYHTQGELDLAKIDIMKLKHQVKELTDEPDAPPPPVKRIDRIEILPGYNLSPATIKKIRSELRSKNTLSEDIIPGELALIDGEWCEVKKPKRSSKAILRSWNIIGNEKPEKSFEMSPEITYLNDSTVEIKESGTIASCATKYSSAGVEKPEVSVELSPEIEYLNDNTVEGKENDPVPSYAMKYRSAGVKKSDNNSCKQQ